VYSSGAHFISTYAHVCASVCVRESAQACVCVFVSVYTRMVSFVVCVCAVYVCACEIVSVSVCVFERLCVCASFVCLRVFNTR
jgi:hypothetical protein